MKLLWDILRPLLRVGFIYVPLIVIGLYVVAVVIGWFMGAK